MKKVFFRYTMSIFVFNLSLFFVEDPTPTSIPTPNTSTNTITNTNENNDQKKNKIGKKNKRLEKQKQKESEGREKVNYKNWLIFFLSKLFFQEREIKLNQLHEERSQKNQINDKDTIEIDTTTTTTATTSTSKRSSMSLISSSKIFLYFNVYSFKCQILIQEVVLVGNVKHV